MDLLKRRRPRIRTGRGLMARRYAANGVERFWLVLPNTDQVEQARALAAASAVEEAAAAQKQYHDDDDEQGVRVHIHSS
jgi:tRNA C32,U32 (ribose-2'-O)-methylase TrmJ